MSPMDDRIPDILERVDMHALVLREGAVESNRVGTYHCPAPAHEDRTPSFTVKAGHWRCWSACAADGDAIDLLIWLRGLTKAEAIDELAALVGLERRTEAPAPAMKAERDLLLSWCRRRGWGPWVADELGLSVVADSFGRPRVRFPFRLNGAVPYHQDRAADDHVAVRWLSPKGGRPIPYEADRLHLARERGYVFVVEGLTDVAALVDVYTSPAVVGIPGAGAWRSSWAPAFADLGVYIFADNDGAGATFRGRVEADLRPAASAVWQVAIPGAHNDVAAWRRGLDPERFDAELMAAVEAVSGRPVAMAG